jgi:hypothetical protein
VGSGPLYHRLPFTFWNNKWGVHSDKRCRKYNRNISVKSDNGKNILLCRNGVLYRFCRKRTIKRSLLCCARLHADADADPNPNADANTYSNSNSDSNPNPNPNTDPNTYSNSNTNTYPNPNTDPDANTYSNSNTDPNTNTYPNSDSNTDPNANADANANTNTNTNTNADPNTNTNANTNSHSKAERKVEGPFFTNANAKTPPSVIIARPTFITPEERSIIWDTRCSIFSIGAMAPLRAGCQWAQPAPTNPGPIVPAIQLRLRPDPP